MARNNAGDSTFYLLKMTTLNYVLDEVEQISLVQHSFILEAEDSQRKLDVLGNWLSIVVQNFRSINKNLNAFEAYLARLNYLSDIILLNVTG